MRPFGPPEFSVTIPDPQTEVSSRPKRSEVEGPAVCPSALPSFPEQTRTSTPNRIVIPTEAYPDFLPRCTGQDRVCALPQRRAHELRQRHQIQQEIRGSEVEGPAVPCRYEPNFAGSAVLSFVIPTEAKRSGGICSAPLGPPEFSVTIPNLNPQTEVSSRPKRTRISCHAAPDRTAYAPFRKEGRMNCTHQIQQEIRGSESGGTCCAPLDSPKFSLTNPDTRNPNRNDLSTSFPASKE